MKLGMDKGLMSLRPLSLAVMLTGVATASHAELGQNLAIDLKALTLGNAVTADPPGVSAVHFNPAALTHIQGLQVDVQGLVADFNIRREMSAPKGYNVFGYSDDPIVCDQMVPGQKLCGNYRNYAVSKMTHPVLYVPFLKKMVNVPDGLPLAAPLGGVAYKPPGSMFTFATAFYAPLIAGFGNDKKDPGNYMGQQVTVERVTYLSPSAAYKISDDLSVGASVGMSYNALGLDSDLRFPNQLIGVLRLIDEDVCAPFRGNGNIVSDLLLFGLCNASESVGPYKKFGSLKMTMEQSLSPSYNLGMLWEPRDDFGLGMVYQSSSKMQMKGKFVIDNSVGAQQLISSMQTSVTGAVLSALLGFPSAVPAKEAGIVSMNLQYPAHFQAGVKYKPLPDLQFNFDVGWTDYSAWNEMRFNFDREISALKIARLLAPSVTPTSLGLPTNFVSPWNWGIGMEYSATDRLKLRLGYEPRTSAIPMNRRNTMIPINNAQLFGAGVGYRLDPDTDVDLSLAHLRSRDNIPACSSHLSNACGVDNLLLNPYAGLDVKTNTQINIMGISYRTKW